MPLLPCWDSQSSIVNTDTIKKIVQETVDRAQALVVLTKWDEFMTYPRPGSFETFMKPGAFFDWRISSGSGQQQWLASSSGSGQQQWQSPAAAAVASSSGSGQQKCQWPATVATPAEMTVVSWS